MKRALKSASSYFAIFTPAVVITIVGFVFAYQFVGPPPPDKITMATGSEQGAYYHFGQAYAKWLEQHGIELEIIKTSGSVENLQHLVEGNVDIAFVQGGTATGQSALLSLGSMYYEPLWIFYRSDLAFEHLYELKDRSLALGSEFSGTRAIALTIAQENGITPSSQTLSSADTVQGLKEGRIDAAFFVASPEAPLIKQLLSDLSLQVLNMERAEAYTRRHSFLSQVDIAEGMLDMERNIPPKKISLISPTANLVSQPDTHPALVDLVLQAAESVHGQGGMFEQPGEFPAPKFLEFPLSPDAARYYEYGPPFLQRYLPFWVATLIDRLKVLILPFLVLLIPLSKILPLALRWRIRRKIIRCYKELQALDLAMDKDDIADGVEKLRQDVDRIEREVTQVNVPLGYADQLYNLRLHIGLVKEKCARIRD